MNGVNEIVENDPEANALEWAAGILQKRLAEVIALREIDFRKIGTGETGPITRRLQRAFSKAVRGQHKLSAKWLDYVGAERLPVVSEPAEEERRGRVAEAN